MANKFFASIKARFFSTAAVRAVDIGVNGDTDARLAIDAGGRISWGSGISTPDVYVQRAGEESINFVGNVGINTNTPIYELDVTGTASVNKVNFDLGTNDLTQNGDLAWDDLDQALAYRTNGLTVDIGQENLVYVRNPSGGSTITKGSVVAVLGSDSNRLSVQLCDATAGAGLGCRTVGIVMQDIASPGFGFVSTFGLLRGFNTGNIIGTTAVNPGTELFISSTPGVLSTDPQSSPGRRVTVGYVVTTGTQGSIFVTIRRGLAVNELDNVVAPSPANGDILTYNNELGVWATQKSPIVKINYSSTDNTSSQQIDSISVNSVKYQIHCSDDTNSEVLEILAIKNGTAVNFTEYARITIGSEVASFDVVYSSGNMALEVSPIASSSSYDVVRTIISV